MGAGLALTDTWLKANDGRERAALEVRSDRDGLGVRVSPNGKITFQLRYRYDGAAKRVDLGTYRSAFIAGSLITMEGGPVAFVRGWLDEAANDPSWKQAEEAARQFFLF